MVGLHMAGMVLGHMVGMALVHMVGMGTGHNQGMLGQFHKQDTDHRML